MSAELQYTADDVPFDLQKEQRISIQDSRELIVIDVDRVGDGYRAIINGCEFELPGNLPTIADARRVAVELAVKEIAAAAKQLIDTYFD
jgi:hypothetical protein